MKIQLNYYSEMAQQVRPLGLPYDISKHETHWDALNQASQDYFYELPELDLIIFWTVEVPSTDLWPEDAIDHQEVLRKYVKLVADEEGMNPAYGVRNAYFSDVDFTLKEWNWLVKLGEEAYDER